MSISEERRAAERSQEGAASSAKCNTRKMKFIIRNTLMQMKDQGETRLDNPHGVISSRRLRQLDDYEGRFAVEGP